MGFPENETELEQSIVRGVSERRTICELFRELYDLVHELPRTERNTREAMFKKIKEGYLMGKRMDRRLRFYKADWDSRTAHPNFDFEEDYRRRKTR